MLQDSASIITRSVYSKLQSICRTFAQCRPFDPILIHIILRHSILGLGFSSKYAATDKMPGWLGYGAPTWGYHGDDGCKFASQNQGEEYSVGYGPGDTVGCGVSFTDDRIFYTKNGTLLRKTFQNPFNSFIYVLIWAFIQLPLLRVLGGACTRLWAWDQSIGLRFGLILGSGKMCLLCIGLNRLVMGLFHIALIVTLTNNAVLVYVRASGC